MDIPLSVLAQGGAAGMGWLLTGLAVWMILTGKLVPGSLYQEARETGQTWQKAFEVERQKNLELLVPVARTQRDFIRALPTPAATPDDNHAPTAGEVGS